jgi:hypothetical protein
MPESKQITMETATPTQYDPRPQHFIKMFKDGTYDCTLVPKGREELDQCTMELEYVPQPPTDEEKIKYQVEKFKRQNMLLSDETLVSMAKEVIRHPNFNMPAAFDPNASRVHDDPTYFFVTPAKPVIWCWKRGSPEEAKAEADAYRNMMIESGEWDNVVKRYKEQYNVLEG